MTIQHYIIAGASALALGVLWLIGQLLIKKADKFGKLALVCFLFLVIFDSTAFSITHEKFGVLGSIASMLKTTKNFVSVITK